MVWANMLQSISARERNSRLVKWSSMGGKQSSLKVVAYGRWSKTFGILEKWSLIRGGRLQEVVAKGGNALTYSLNLSL